MPKRLAKREEGVDVDLKRDEEGAAAELLANALSTKGFCVVEPHLDESLLEQVLNEVELLKEQDRFIRPPALVAEGLLGLEGSSQIAELVSPEESYDGKDGPGLGRLDSLMTDTAQELGPFFDSIGFDFTHRTRSVVHETGIPTQSPDLTEHHVTTWLEKFLRHKVMAIVFVGPIVGNLKLQVHEDEDVDSYEIPVPPGRMVLLRPDILAHEYVSLGKATAVSTFFIQGQAYKKNHATGGFLMCPVAKEMDKWAMDRVAQLRAEQKEGSMRDPDIPAEFQRAMDLFFLKDRHTVAIRGFAARLPTTWDPAGWFGGMIVGTDMPIRIPFQRWDHDPYYEPHPEGWRYGKTFSQHGAFMDGPEFFDNKMFSISTMEARTMDPNQRLILEVAYGALYNMGLKKNHLMNAHSGVFLGYTFGEYNYVPQMDTCKGPTGGAGCVASNRVSFCLGMKGPSFTIDTECSSSLQALYLCAEANQKKGMGVSTDHGCAIGATMMLSPMWWAGACAAGWMTSMGRCFTFDVSASGYVRSEGSCAAAMKSLNEVVDGEIVEDETKGVLGVLAGASSNHNGKSASLKAPNSIGEQEVIMQTCRAAGISPDNIDAVEAHGAGAYLSDIVEVSSLTRVHRSDSTTGQPLSIMALKTNTGNLMETGGIAAFMKIVLGQQWGLIPPNQHLRELNPQMDIEQVDINFISEVIQYPRVHSYSGVMSMGCGGTNVYATAWGMLDPDKVPSSADFPAQREMITFWPGGGGELEEQAVPLRGYFIVGSWSQWTDPVPMTEDPQGTFTAIVTLGENSWEQFQIWMDADADKILHPGWPKAGKETAVEGPEAEAGDNSWMIDGRSWSWEVPEQDALTVNIPAPTNPDAGKPGDKYRISLRIAGAWRMVAWEKEEELEEGEALPVESAGRYYVLGSWDDWTLTEMSPDTKQPGVFTVQVTLTTMGGLFNISRNRDMSQILYPGDVIDDTGETSVEGPEDPEVDAPSWYIDGRSGETFLIEFQRTLGSGQDMKKVSWKRL